MGYKMFAVGKIQMVTMKELYLFAAQVLSYSTAVAEEFEKENKDTQAFISYITDRLFIYRLEKLAEEFNNRNDEKFVSIKVKELWRLVMQEFILFNKTLIEKHPENKE